MQRIRLGKKGFEEMPEKSSDYFERHLGSVPLDGAHYHFVPQYMGGRAVTGLHELRCVMDMDTLIY